MQFEIVIIAAIIIFVLNYTGRINTNKFITDNTEYFRKLKEDDWDFLVKARYGDGVNPDILFTKRIQNAGIVLVLCLFIFISNFNYSTFLVSLIAAYLMFKSGYNSMKKYYKKHLNDIDSMLPHYLKSLEILIQHYTVPVAIGKSITDAPPIFREGLQEMINEINAGNDKIDPYMNFAKEYPVRDSMRMMRLLYRLSLGKQEHKQEQLLAFSKTISNLQQKARETRYKNRLDKMESKTMAMLITTGLGVMVLLIFAVLKMMSI